MKKYVLVITAIIVSFQLNAQYPVQIGTPYSGGELLPYNNQYDYNWCTSLYPQNRINVHGDIVKMTYRLSTPTGNIESANNQRIYMVLTSDVEFSDAGYPNTASMTLVYDGTIVYDNASMGPSHYTEIKLTTPFPYNNTDNLIIHFENGDGTKNPTSSEAYIDLTDNSYTTNMCKYNYQDGSFPTSTGSLTTKMPIVYLGFDSGLDVGIETLNNNITEFLPGIHDITVDFRNYMGDTINSCDINWELNSAPQTPVNWTGTLYTGQASNEITLLDDYDFAPGTYQFKIWTSNPNAGVDELNTNDTITKTITVANYIEVGHQSNATSAYPYPTVNWYGWSSSIYPLDSMQTGRIYGIAYKVNSNGHFKDNQHIYMSETTESVISTTDYPDVETINLVYNGDFDFSGTGWKKVLFDSSFVLNNNLIVHYQNRSGVYNSPQTTFASSQYGSQTTVWKGDNTSFPETSGSFSTFAPMVRFYFALPNDAGISSLDIPGTYFNTGNNMISVSLKNYGTDALTSANIKYQIDNGTINTYNWTGSLSCYDTEQFIIIGDENFTYGEHTIKIWTDLPNGLNDYNAENDTLLKTVYATNPLCGTYIIGSSPSDYSTLKEAVDSLNSAGVSCDVVFDIKPGTYNDQYMINKIKDAGENSTITFKSQTGDSTDVILTTDSTDYLFNLNGADYLRFEYLTFTSDSADKLMVLDSGACNNIFDGNQFTDGVYHIYNTATSIADTNNAITNNLFVNGKTSVYFNSVNPALETGNVISANKFENQSWTSVDNSYQERLCITGNSFETYKLAISCDIIKNCAITKNNIFTSYEAMAFFGGSDTNLVANNFIICEGNTASGFGIRLQISNLKFYNNTIKLIGEQSTNTSIIVVWGYNNVLKNNILVNFKAGPTITVGGTYTGNLSDYNCLYTNGGSIANWQNTNCADLTEWQAASGQAANSISILPDFVSETDLHTNTLALDNAGTQLAEITDDIDGDARNATNPDIGADEFTSTCSGVLSGSYIIGTSGDYLTFNDAIYALRNCGVNGTVIFNIKSGTYNEQVNIGEFIPGYTENDSIIFQSQSGDSTSVILTYDADTLYNYTLRLNGIDRAVFKQITIQAEDTTYGRVIEIGNGACNNLIENCIINGVESTNNNSNKALVHFSEDNTSRDTCNVIKGNKLINGSYGINLIGNDSGDSFRETFNIISGNTFTNQSAYGIYANYQVNLLVKENTFENDVDIDFNFYAIKNDDSDSTVVSKNIFNLQREYFITAIYIYNYHNYNLIANNFISVGSNTAAAYGINCAGYNTKIYYNSINIYGGSSNSIAVDVTYTTKNADIKNNIFANYSGGYALYCRYNSSQVLSADYNNLYSNGANIANWLETDIASLSQWQAATGFGSNSVSSYPNFVSNTDLHTSNVLLNNAGTSLAEVTDDIDGETRDAGTPDIGADEFAAVTFSLGDDVTVCVDAEYKIDAGVGFDTYLWSTGADSSYILVDSTEIGYGSKEYFVTVTLDGNSYDDSITVTFSSPIAMEQNYYCADASTDSVLLTAGDGVEYYWSTGETTQSIWLSATYVYLTVTDANGCVATEYITREWVNCPANLDMPSDTTIYLGETLILDANSISCNADYDEYSYLWSTDETTETITVDATALGVGSYSYSVSVTNISSSNTCITTDMINVNVSSSNAVGSLVMEGISIYPNPTNGILKLEFSNIIENTWVRIVNVTGQVVYSEYQENILGIKTLDLSGLDKGVYILSIENKNTFLTNKITLY